MHGRNCSRFFAISAVMLVTAILQHPSLHAQTNDQTINLPSKQALILAARTSAHEIPTPPIGAPVRLPIRPGTIGLPQIARAAATIFSGTVISVTPVTQSGGQSLETVAITFRVERSLRGARVPQLLTISQWCGLWASGQQYHVGERVLLFLYPPSKLGLTSSVDGSMGRFNIDALGRVQLSQPQIAAFRDDPFLGGRRQVSFDDISRSLQRTIEAERLLP
jgi:hypothetical protein